MSEGVLAIDNNKRLLMINKTGEEYLDIKSNLIIGQTADVVISDKRFLKFIDDLLLSKKNLLLLLPKTPLKLTSLMTCIYL